MAWGMPEPSVQRSNNPIVDDRFEHILAWSSQINQHLDGIESLLHSISDSGSSQFSSLQQSLQTTLSTLREQIVSTEDHLKIYVKSTCDAVSSNVDSMTSKLSDENRLHSEQLQQVEDRLAYLLNAAESAIRAHVWDDLRNNLSQRTREHLLNFWYHLTRPLPWQ